MKRIAGLVIALAAIALAACSSQEGGPYVEVRGGGFLFNYRIAEVTVGLVVTPLRTLPDGAKLEATMENPAGGAPIVFSVFVAAGAQKYDFTSPPLSGVKADTDYKVTLRLVAKDGKALQTIEKNFRSQLDQSTLPEKPLTIGPGYTKNPELETPAPAQ